MMESSGTQDSRDAFMASTEEVTRLRVEVKEIGLQSVAKTKPLVVDKAGYCVWPPLCS